MKAAYLSALLSFTTENKDEAIDAYSGVSYNEAIRLCDDFVNGSDESEKFFVYPREGF